MIQLKKHSKEELEAEIQKEEEFLKKLEDDKEVEKIIFKMKIYAEMRIKDLKQKIEDLKEEKK